MWNDWPLKGKVGDVGIDLVAQERATRDYCAVQCKFYSPDHSIAKTTSAPFLLPPGKRSSPSV
ncbi:MAG: hypothetical protein JNK54_10210 [Elusimicrobia bacterium]|nr:hypothetical protein [Elusimicrobiota bacterium]